MPINKSILHTLNLFGGVLFSKALIHFEYFNSSLEHALNDLSPIELSLDPVFTAFVEKQSKNSFDTSMQVLFVVGKKGGRTASDILRVAIIKTSD